MGKIEIKGYASRKMQCDAMEINVSFIAEANSSEEVSRQVIEQCELFLEKLEEIGVDINKIQIGDDSVHKSTYRDTRIFEAKRELTLKSEFDMVFVSTIREILYSIKAETDIRTNFILSNREEIKAELLKEALLDSQKKANDIAETLGQKIIGIVSANKKSGYDFGDEEIDGEREYVMHKRNLLVPQFVRANALQSPEITETEEIIAVWEIG